MNTPDKLNLGLYLSTRPGSESQPYILKILQLRILSLWRDIGGRDNI
jgi:hypothetical protein